MPVQSLNLLCGQQLEMVDTTKMHYAENVCPFQDNNEENNVLVMHINLFLQWNTTVVKHMKLVMSSIINT